MRLVSTSLNFILAASFRPVRSAMGDRAGLATLAAEARVAGKHNVAFSALLLLGQVRAGVG